MPSDTEKQAILSLYSERLRDLGPVPAALGWNKLKHRLRYKVLAGYWDLVTRARPARVLDFGCGFGDLSGWLAEQGWPAVYTGVDINPDLVAVARARYPGARFMCGDLSDLRRLDERFDVVVSSGVHNFRLRDTWSFIRETMAVFSSISVDGFSLNFLSDRVTFARDENFHASPAVVLEEGLRHSRRVSLRHDYMPYEFTVHVDKRERVDDDLNVFEPYVADC